LGAIGQASIAAPIALQLVPDGDHQVRFLTGVSPFPTYEFGVTEAVGSPGTAAVQFDAALALPTVFTYQGNFRQTNFRRAGRESVRSAPCCPRQGVDCVAKR
jgi:hypothetical protein